MRIQSTHSLADRDLDQYMSPPCAIDSLMAIENVPKHVWEMCCGDGTGMVMPLREAGHVVRASDIDPKFGFEEADYLHAPAMDRSVGLVTNPPFMHALPMLEKAISESAFVAFLLRTNFLESGRRLPFFRNTPPSRVWISSRRLPMMHRVGWTGPTASSNTCFAWFVWSTASTDTARIGWFDWADYSPAPVLAQHDRAGKTQVGARP
jgi:hypothetical protein